METSGAVATPSLLRMPDFGKAVTNLEGNIRKTIHTAKKTITSARKSFSCVSFPEEDGNRPQALSTETAGGPDSAENDQLSGVGGPDSGSEEGSNMLPNNLATLDLLEKARRLANGVEMKDRHYRLKLYTCCFVGEEAVEWMVKEGMVENVDAAVELGNSMREHGLLRHVTDEHPFENKDYFYRFTDFDATGEGSVCSNRSGGQQLGLFRGVNSDGDWTLGTEVVRLQRRVSELSSQLKLHRSLNLALFESASEHQQRMEAQGQANADLAGAMERTVALQMLFIGFLMLTVMNGVMGFVLKVVGAVVLWQGAKWTMKSHKDAVDANTDGVFLRLVSLMKGRSMFARLLNALVIPFPLDKIYGTNFSELSSQIVWTVLRNIRALFGPTTWISKQGLDVDSNALTQATVNIARCLVQVISSLNMPKEVCNCFEALAKGDLMSTDGGEVTPEDLLLPFMPPDHPPSQPCPFWLEAILVALVEKASKVGLGNRGGSILSGLDVDTSKKWQWAFAVLYGAVTAHLQVLVRVHRVAIERNQPEALAYAKGLLGKDLLTSTLMLCNQDQINQVKGIVGMLKDG